MILKLTRLRADLILLVVAVIWGLAFVTQKTVLDHVGPLFFTGLRFSLAGLVILPFVLREWPRARRLARADWWAVIIPGLFFTAGAFIQQIAMGYVTVTNAGFLTTSYVVIVPFVVWFIDGRIPNVIVWPAALTSIAGIFLLGGGSLSALSAGDLAVLATAVLFSVQIAQLGKVMARLHLWATVTFVQCVMIGSIGLPAGLLLEPFSFEALTAALPEILYGGIISGGLAHSLQAVAQSHTPASDAAIIFSSESLFAALFAALLLGERLSTIGWVGSALIVLAILMIEIGPVIMARVSVPGPPPLPRPPGRG